MKVTVAPLAVIIPLLVRVEVDTVGLAPKGIVQSELTVTPVLFEPVLLIVTKLKAAVPQDRVEASPLSAPSKISVVSVRVRVPPEKVKFLSRVQVPVVAVWVPPETVKFPVLISKVWALPVHIPPA